SWRRLGRGVYVWRDIAEAPMTRLIAAKLRLPDAAVFTGRTAAWLHGLDIPPCKPIEAAVPSTYSTSRLVGVVVRRRSISVMETRLRLLLVLAGLPHPRSQVSLRDDLGLFLARPDLYYPDARLAIEYDGATHCESLAADNRRQNRMFDAGYRLLRFTAGDVLDTPAAVVSMVRRALQAPSDEAPMTRPLTMDQWAGRH